MSIYYESDPENMMALMKQLQRYLDELNADGELQKQLRHCGKEYKALLKLTEGINNKLQDLSKGEE